MYQPFERSSKEFLLGLNAVVLVCANQLEDLFLLLTEKEIVKFDFLSERGLGYRALSNFGFVIQELLPITPDDCTFSFKEDDLIDLDLIKSQIQYKLRILAPDTKSNSLIDQLLSESDESDFSDF